MADEKKLSKVEGIKVRSEGLYGPIAEEFSDKELSHFSEDSVQVLKHHGTYQQDNRDLRRERRKAGLDKAWTMMVRTKTPGGLMTPAQYLLCDNLADRFGQEDMRITSRQGFQFHGIVKGNLYQLIHDLNHFERMTTLGACGDVVRNVMSSSVADIDPKYEKLGADLMKVAEQISNATLPKTSSYFDLWLNDEKVQLVDGEVVFKEKKMANKNEEPLYGKTYLPRKFKIGLCLDNDNSVDIYTQDIGIIAVTKDGAITGYEVLAGGGLGHSHSKQDTYARLGSHITFVSAEQLMDVVYAIIKVQRDFGNREERHQARLKYTVDRLGLDEFRKKVAEYSGLDPLPEPSGATVSDQPDYLGWHKQYQPGMNYVGIWVENGRIRDFDKWKFKSGFKALVEKFNPSVRLTAHHNVVLANIRDEDVDAVKRMMADFGLPTDDGVSKLRRHEMACPALPLCGLALSEAERELPGVMDQLEAAGHADDDVVIRMTGCPNSCARPETAELGIIGRGPGKYNLYAGGDKLGRRMNTLVAENVTSEELPVKMSALLNAWKAERNGSDKTFGDWANEKGVENLQGVLG